MSARLSRCLRGADHCSGRAELRRFRGIRSIRLRAGFCARKSRSIWIGCIRRTGCCIRCGGLPPRGRRPRSFAPRAAESTRATHDKSGSGFRGMRLWIEIALRFRAICCGVWERGYSALFLWRNFGSAEWRVHGPQIFPSPGCFATGSDDLLGGRRGGAEVGSGREAGHRAGAVPAFQIHHCVGFEYSRQQCSFVAVYCRGTPQGGEAGSDRPLPHADGGVR